ncbi:MAG: SpoIIE family protein phosphatase [Alteromonadaceae bacterium]|nr:SpoIIE family protein phosphatase [Alteromonadaceae bacterium]
MSYITQVSHVEQNENALAFLQNILRKEIGNCTLIMVNSLGLSVNHFQMSHYCNGRYCPIYSAAELLNPQTKARTFSGAFIETWKAMRQPNLVQKEDCLELFRDDLAAHDEVLVLPILIDLKIERWVLVLNAENDIATIDLSKLSLLVNFAVLSLVRSAEKKQLDEITIWRDQELKEISRLQHLLLPEAGTAIPGIEVAFKYQVYKEAGGDYFDITSLADDRQSTEAHRFGAIIADVTGHGPSAAVEAAMLDAILRTYTPTDGGEESPAAVLTYVNKHFFTRKTRGKFITALTFSYEPTLRRLRYACAGHPYGFIKRGQQLIKLDQSKDIPIGVLTDYQWHNHDVFLQHHDIVFVYTDVVLETRDTNGEEFGFERLEQVLINSESCPHCVVNEVADALTAFSGTDELCDDLTLCGIQIFS